MVPCAPIIKRNLDHKYFLLFIVSFSGLGSLVHFDEGVKSGTVEVGKVEKPVKGLIRKLTKVD